MEKIALITDSASDLSKEEIDRYKIKVLHFKVIIGNNIYLDGIEIASREIYEKIKTTMISTSVPSLEDIRLLFEELKRDGYTHAIFITISSGLSSTANQISLQSKEVEGIETFIFDSKSISMGEGVQVIECAKLIKKGKPFSEIIKMLPEIRSRVVLYFLVPTLEYLIRGGRIGRVTGRLGQILSIKPVISVGEDGKYFTVENARGWNNALSKIVSIGKNILDENASKIFIRHAANEKDANYIYEQLKSHPHIKEISVGEISAVAGVHSGPGLVGVAFYKEEKSSE